MDNATPVVLDPRISEEAGGHPETFIDEAMAATDVKAILEDTLISNPYIPNYQGMFPSPKQLLMLALPCTEILYGGAARGGKTVSLVASALQYVNRPNYKAILFRRRMTDMALPGSILSLMHNWLDRTNARYDSDSYVWHFPSGAQIAMGYLGKRGDHERYQGAVFHYIGFDELTHFYEYEYDYLFTRLWKERNDPIPLRMRAGTNPGGPGADWVMRRFMLFPNSSRIFIPATIDDNPAADRKAYETQLRATNLDPVTIEQLLNGNWTITAQGNMFRLEWLLREDTAPDCEQMLAVCRAWDIAATVRSEANPDPDWTAGVKMARDASGKYHIMDMQAIRDTPDKVEALIRKCADQDGAACQILMEQQPAASGKREMRYYQDLLRDRMLIPISPYKKPKSGTADEPRKINMARPLSTAFSKGLIRIARTEMLNELVLQLVSFPESSHDDYVDAAAMAFNYLQECTPGMPTRFPELPESLCYDSDRILGRIGINRPY